MDISSIGLNVFALTIFLLSLGATIVASIISQRVLDQHRLPVAGPGLYMVNGIKSRKAVSQTGERKEEDFQKAA